MWEWAVSVGDCLSQLGGRCIPVRIDGRWQTYTMSPNESISGASYRWHVEGYFSWPMVAIDFVFEHLFRNPQHCYKVWVNDALRNEEYLEVYYSFEA